MRILLSIILLTISESTSKDFKIEDLKNVKVLSIPVETFRQTGKEKVPKVPKQGGTGGTFNIRGSNCYYHMWTKGG